MSEMNEKVFLAFEAEHTKKLKASLDAEVAHARIASKTMTALYESVPGVREQMREWDEQVRASLQAPQAPPRMPRAHDARPHPISSVTTPLPVEFNSMRVISDVNKTMPAG